MERFSILPTNYHSPLSSLLTTHPVLHDLPKSGDIVVLFEIRVTFYFTRDVHGLEDGSDQFQRNKLMRFPIRGISLTEVASFIINGRSQNGDSFEP